MEHKMHKAERQLSDADTMAILKKGDHGTLRALWVQDRVPEAGPQVLLLRHHLRRDHPQQDHGGL